MEFARKKSLKKTKKVLTNRLAYVIINTVAGQKVPGAYGRTGA